MEEQRRSGQEQVMEQPARVCPLCGEGMVPRRRDPLLRFLGLALIYGAALLFLLWVPSLAAAEVAGVAALGLYGWALARRREHWWCPECWFRGAPRPPGGERRAGSPQSSGMVPNDVA